MHFKTAAIIFNPNRSADTARELESKLTRRGIAVRLLETSAAPNSAADLARQAAAEGIDFVIALGGDGTACKVAEGLIGTRTVMAVFPGGTGNLFVRGYYNPPTTDQFVDMVLNGTPQAIDMVRLDYTDEGGTAHSDHLIVALGIGKVSDAISEASPAFKKWLGKLAYVIRVTLACLLPRAQRFSIQARDKQLSEDAAAVFVLNSTPPMMSMMLSRGCNASDGLLDVVVFKGRNTWHLIKIAACLAFGRPENSSHYSAFRTNELTISANGLVKPNIDGDPGMPTRKLKLTAEPGAVRMILSR